MAEPARQHSSLGAAQRHEAVAAVASAIVSSSVAAVLRMSAQVPGLRIAVGIFFSAFFFKVKRKKGENANWFREQTFSDCYHAVSSSALATKRWPALRPAASSSSASGARSCASSAACFHGARALVPVFNAPGRPTTLQRRVARPSRTSKANRAALVRRKPIERRWYETGGCGSRTPRPSLAEFSVSTERWCIASWLAPRIDLKPGRRCLPRCVPLSIAGTPSRAPSSPGPPCVSACIDVPVLLARPFFASTGMYKV